MSQKKLGSLKRTDTIISGYTDLAADVSSTVLPVANGGTGSGSFTNGQLLIGNTTGNTLTKASLTGTTNQVVVTNGTGSITLSLPQDIGTGSSPSFVNITASSKVDTPEVSHAGTILFDPGSGNWLRFNTAGAGGQWAFISSNGDGFHIDRTDVNDNGTEMEFLTGASLKWEFGRLGDGTENFILKNQATGVSSFSANGTTGVISLYNPVLATPTSGTLVNCTGLPVSTGLSGLGTGVATFLATPSSANLAAALTDETGSGANVFAASATMTNAIVNQAANGDTAIKSVRATDTTPTGNFLDFQTAAAASVFKVDRFGALTANITAQASTAERLMTFGVSDSGSTFTLDNGTSNANFFSPTFNGTIEATVEGVPISFFGTKGVDTATNPAILFLGRHNTGGGNTDLSATVPLAEFRNRATSLVYVYGNGDLRLIRSGATLGYGTGAGGSVTQATNRTTGVTLSRPTGAITTNTTSLAAGASATFTVTNTVVAAIDVVTVAIKSGQTNKETSVAVTAVAAGSFDITVHNQHASTAETGAIVINFAIIKGATS